VTAWRKYAAFVLLGWSQARQDRVELYGRVAFVAIILGVFSALWRAVAAAGMPLGLDRPALVWYLACTEWILLSGPPIHVEIEGDVRRGDVTSQLLRPYSYPLALAARGVGMLAVRAPVVGASAVLCAWWLTGVVPAAGAVLRAAPLAVLAMTQIYALYVVIGLTAFWLDEVTPIFWIVQKLLFVLGGLMLPIALFPIWMQRIGRWTPFPYLLARPASFLLPGPGDVWSALWPLVTWAVVLAGLAHVLFVRAVRSLQTHGG
jgi:ABC-2 type transport system permease protein